MRKETPNSSVPKTRWRRLILVLVGLAAIGAGLIAFLKPHPGVSLTELNSLDELKAQFDRDKGKPRLVLLLSPT